MPNSHGKYVSVCLYMALSSACGQNTFVACVIGDGEVDYANQCILVKK